MKPLFLLAFSLSLVVQASPTVSCRVTLQGRGFSLAGKPNLLPLDPTIADLQTWTFSDMGLEFELRAQRHPTDKTWMLSIVDRLDRAHPERSVVATAGALVPGTPQSVGAGGALPFVVVNGGLNYTRFYTNCALY